jgi:hypothetical protein
MTTKAPEPTHAVRGYNYAFQHAILLGNGEGISRMAKEYPDVLRQRLEWNQRTMLMFAIDQSQRASETVGLLISLAKELRSDLESRMRVNDSIKKGKVTLTAMSILAERLRRDPSWKEEHDRISALLIDNGFEQPGSESGNLNHHVSLRRAFATGDLSTIKSLQFNGDSNNGADKHEVLSWVIKADPVGATLLHVAAEHGRAEAARTLLEGLKTLGMDAGQMREFVNMPMITGSTALDLAEMERRLPDTFVEVLPDGSQRTGYIDRTGYAEKADYDKLILLLREHGANGKNGAGSH